MLTLCLFEQLFGDLSDAVVLIDHNGAIVFANNSAKTTLYENNCIDHQIVQQLLELKSSNEKLFKLKKDTFSVNCSESELGTLIILRNVSHYIQKVYDLNESERLFRALFENSPGGIIMMSADMRIMAANKYFCSLMGVTFDSVIDTNVIETIHEQDRDLYVSKVHMLLTSDLKSFECEKRIYLSDNTLTTVLSTVSVVKDEHANPLYLIEQLVNITKRKIAEQALRNSEFRFNQFFNSSTVMYLIVSGSTFKVIDCNKTFCENTGYNKTSIVDKKIETFFIPQNENQIKRLFLNNDELIKSYDTEVELKTNDDTTIYVSISATEMLDKTTGNNSYILACTNIEKQLKIRNELTEAKNNAEKSDRLKTAFLSNMSHEIRTPMNGIVGFTDLLATQSELSDKHKSYVAIIKECSLNLLKIIENIIDISKLDSGTLILKTELFDLGNMLIELEEKFNKKLKETGKDSVSIVLDNKLMGNELYINADKVRVRQILNILFDNAVKFTDFGSIIIGGTYEPHKNVTLWISDTGIGIESNQQDMIFERFRQVDERYERKYDGTGLGLSIVSGIVKLMKGAVWLESEENKGSTFYVRFPI